MTDDDVAAWPLVADKDDGIRPAGRPDECFYCKSRVGHPHARACVVVKKRIAMRVRAVLPSGDVLDGVWQFDEPYAWEPRMSEFHKNEGSWCASNFLLERRRGTVAWEAGDPWDDLEGLERAGDCLCGRLSFAFLRVVDGTPRRALQPPSDAGLSN
jgi:hypothetical protein